MNNVERRGGNVRVVCQAYGIPVGALRAALAAGAIKSVAAGRRTVITFTDVEAWLATLSAPKLLRGIRPGASRSKTRNVSAAIRPGA
jgi:hypothetical protein